MIYKVLRKFWDIEKKTEYKAGTYVEIEDDNLLKIKTRIRRRDLLLARDQKGAKKLVGVVDPRKYHEQRTKKKQDKVVLNKSKQKVKNVKTNKKSKNSVS